MNISMRKIKVLYAKDFKDLFKNASVLITALIPVFFMVIYKNMTFGNTHMPNEFLIKLGMVLNLGMSTMIIISTTVAEEKEKNTMRTLMLSNVSGLEFFISKMLAPLTFLTVTNIIIYLVVGMDLKYLAGFLIFTLLGGICMVMIGAIIGILARDQMTAGVYQVPVMLVMFLPSIFGSMNEGIEKLAKFTPTEAVCRLFFAQIDGGLFTLESLLSVLVLIAWTILCTVLFVVIFRKKGVDN